MQYTLSNGKKWNSSNFNFKKKTKKTLPKPHTQLSHIFLRINKNPRHSSVLLHGRININTDKIYINRSWIFFCAGVKQHPLCLSGIDVKLVLVHTCSVFEVLTSTLLVCLCELDTHTQIIITFSFHNYGLCF